MGVRTKNGSVLFRGMYKNILHLFYHNLGQALANPCNIQAVTGIRHIAFHHLVY